MPVCDSTTSTRSRSIENGWLQCSKWTVIAIYNLWLGEDQVSMPKFSFPSYSYCTGWVLELSYENSTDLQCLSKMPTHMNKYIFDVERDCLHWRDVVIRPPCLYKGLKATVIDNLEGLVTFCDPAYDFCTVRDLSDACQTKCKSNIPCLYLGMLMVTVHSFSFGYLLKCSHDQPIISHHSL